MLINAGANIDLETHSGYNALMISSLAGRDEIFKILQEKSSFLEDFVKNSIPLNYRDAALSDWIRNLMYFHRADNSGLH